MCPSSTLILPVLQRAAEERDDDAFARRVSADEELAGRLRTIGVPAMLVRVDRGDYPLSGAQPYHALEDAIEQARAGEVAR